MYLGKTVSNVWHNSTIIFLFPFALILFWEEYKIIYKKGYCNKGKILLVFILVVLNALIKPSFLFVFIPASLFLILFNNDIRLLRKIKIALPLFLGTFFLGGNVLSDLQTRNRKF